MTPRQFLQSHLPNGESGQAQMLSPRNLPPRNGGTPTESQLGSPVPPLLDSPVLATELTPRELSQLQRYLGAVLNNHGYRGDQNNDLIQEVFVRWCEWGRRIVPNALLPIVVRNLARTAHRNETRRAKRVKQVADLNCFPSSGEPVIPASSDEMLDRLRKAIRELPPRLNAMIAARLRGLTQEETGEQLSISIRTVRNREKRALNLLRRWLVV